MPHSKFLTQTAFYISVLTHPIFLFFYVFMYFLLETKIFVGIMQIYKFWLVITYLVVNSILIPLILIFFFERKFNINERKKRTLPYLIMLIIYVLIYLFFQKFFFPPIIKDFLLSITIGLFILFIMNRLMKISMHTTSAGASVALFLFMYMNSPQDFYIPLTITFIIAGLVGTSRLILQVHTNPEIYAGYFTGFLTTFIVLNT